MTSTESVWKTEVPDTSTYPALTHDIKTDVVIVGGGISGVTAAYLLSKKGKKVVLLEKNTVGSGVTGYTTAFVTYDIDKPITEIVADEGKEMAAKIWKSGISGLDAIDHIIREEQIVCQFQRCPAYIYAANDKAAADLQEQAALAQELGFDATYSRDTVLRQMHHGYMKLEQQAKFHPLLYLRGLAAAAVKAGTQIYENTEVDRIHENDRVTATARNITITAKHAIIATQYPLGGPLIMAAKLIPYNSYVIAADIPSGTLQEALYWDTENPYHYVRVDSMKHHDRIIIGGEDHPTGHTSTGKNPYKKLEEYLVSLIPGVKYRLTHTWSSQVLNTVDGLPYIGRMPFTKGKFIATGYNGTGMVYSTVAAIINTELILGTGSEILYSPTRLKGLSKMIGHTAESFVSFFKGLMQAADNNIDIGKDEGKVVEVNGKKIAIYRDRNGKVMKLSPVCTHLGCIVEWNGYEKTWDCPCHGSRFGAQGKVLQGPAQKPLKVIDKS